MSGSSRAASAIGGVLLTASALLHGAPVGAQPSPSADVDEPKTPYDAPPATSAPAPPSADVDEPKTPYDAPPATSAPPKRAADEARDRRPLPPSAPAPAETAVDPAVPTGMALTVVGGVSFVVGAITLGAAGRRDSLVTGGAMALAGGFGLAGTGIPAMFGGLANPHRHMSDGRMVAGIVLVGLGAANALMGIAYVTSRAPLGEEPDPLPWLLLGFGHLAIGAPLLASGAPEPLDGHHDEARMNSRAMANAGYALLPVGGAMLETALLIFFYPDDIVSLVPMSTSLVVGATLMLTAIPLVVVGRQRDGGGNMAAAPSLRAGPSGVALEWSY